MKTGYRFIRRAPFENDWSDVEEPDNDPIVTAMNAVDTNYLQYSVTNTDIRKRGQMRYFREHVWVEDNDAVTA